MAEVKPFIGLIYNRDIVDRLEDVISPPYDIISPELQENLYGKHPYNIVRLELPLGDGEEKYIEADKTLRLWLESKVLVSIKSPSYYFYEEIYTFGKEERVLRGFFGVVEVEPFEKRVILPHEFTFPKPKEDRFKLLKHIKSNVSPILGIYYDEVGISRGLWEYVKLKEPLFFSDRFKIWIVDDRLEDISNFFKDRIILIADGHHRYETALKYKELMESMYGKPGPYSYVMMFLVDAYSGGLSLLPTHRLIKGASKDFENMLNDSFFLEKTDFIEITQDEHLIYYYKKREAFKFRTEELNVVSLHKFLSNFNDLFITYSHSLDEVKVLVDSGTYELAFIVNPPSMDTLRNIVEKGDRLPQKTTYFYPKIGAGLVIYNHNLNEREMSQDV